MNAETPHSSRFPDCTLIKGEIEIIDKSSERTYKITQSKFANGWGFFLSNESGEGMQINEKALFDMLDAHFKAEF